MTAAAVAAPAPLWRERWKSGMDLVFLKRLELGFEDKPFVEPGEAVTPELRERLGGDIRLKFWWEARVVGSREHAIARGFAVAPRSDRTGNVGNVPSAEVKALGSLVRLGGPWYLVCAEDGTETKVCGRKNAEALLRGG